MQRLLVDVLSCAKKNKEGGNGIASMYDRDWPVPNVIERDLKNWLLHTRRHLNAHHAQVVCTTHTHIELDVQTSRA